MKTTMNQITIVASAVPCKREWHGQALGRTAVVLLVGASIGAVAWLASAADNSGDGSEARLAATMSICASKEAPVECSASSFAHLENMMPDRISRIFPTSGI